jgi:hypothetical protein
MAATKRAGDHRKLSAVAKSILRDVREDFMSKNLSSKDLTQHYVGISIAALQSKYCEGAGHSQVDFDLALKELEGSALVKTGPVVPFDNPPGSSVFVIGLRSKREYAYLTEAGYRAAGETDNQTPRTSQPRVHISGGTFHQSQIGIGDQVTQTQKVDIENDAEVIERLAELLLTTGTPVGAPAKAEIMRLVEVTRAANLNEARPIFQKLFGLASEGAKQAAWGILTAIITKAMGM